MIVQKERTVALTAMVEDAVAACTGSLSCEASNPAANTVDISNLRHFSDNMPIILEDIVFADHNDKTNDRVQK